MDPREAVAEAAARLSRAVGEGAASVGRQLAQGLPPPLRMAVGAPPSGSHVDDRRATSFHVARLQDPFQDPPPSPAPPHGSPCGRHTSSPPSHATLSPLGTPSQGMRGLGRPQNDPLQELASSLTKLQDEAMAHLGRIPARVARHIHDRFQDIHAFTERDPDLTPSGNPLASIRHSSPPVERVQRKPVRKGAAGGSDAEGKLSQEATEGLEAGPKSLAAVRVAKRRTRQASQEAGTGRSNSNRSINNTNSTKSSSRENATTSAKPDAKGKARDEDSRADGDRGTGRMEGGEGEGESEGEGGGEEGSSGSSGRGSVEDFLASPRHPTGIVRLQPWRDSPRHSSPPGPDSYPGHTLGGPPGVMRGMRGGGGAASSMAEELSTLGLRDLDGDAAPAGGGGFWSFLPWNRGGQRTEPRNLGAPAVPAVPAGYGRPDGTELAESFERMPEGAPGSPEVFGQKLHGPTTKEELGRATWTLLHSLAAQYPEKPSRQLQRDVRTFISLLPSVYPCRICGEHFKEVLKSNPPEVGSKAELEQYMCRVHNVVNRSLNKPQFPCKRVAARWGSLECDDRACEL